MVNHKWKDESFSKYHKTELCIKCGVYRNWIGGDMQCWEYWHPDVKIYYPNKFKRPDCASEKNKLN